MPVPADPIARLPHGPAFRFLSEIVELEPAARGAALWRLAGDEWFLADHFPGNPIVPGVLVIEALAQLSGLVGLAEGDGAGGRLAHADVRITAAVAPPATLRLESRLLRTLGALRQFEVEARHGEVVVARGTLALAGAPS